MSGTSNKRCRVILPEHTPTTNKLYNKKKRWSFMLLALIFVEIAFGRLTPGVGRDDAR
jgi:hypothetical protein